MSFTDDNSLHGSVLNRRVEDKGMSEGFIHEILRNITMLNCKQIARIVSESIDRKLSAGERCSLWMHIALCGTCRGFRNLQHRIHEAARLGSKSTTDQMADSKIKLSAESRMRMQRALARAGAGDDRADSPDSADS